MQKRKIYIHTEGLRIDKLTLAVEGFDFSGKSVKPCGKTFVNLRKDNILSFP